MDSSTMRTLEARVASLERRLLRQRVLLAGTAVLTGAALLMGQASPPPSPAPPGELVVRRLQVVTERGTRVVDLGTTARGPYLDFRDTENRQLATLTALNGEGASLALADGTGAERVRLRGAKDEAGLTLSDSEAQARVRISAADRATEVTLGDSTGVPRLFLRSMDRGGTELALSGPDMVERAALRIDPSGRPAFSLVEPSGQFSVAMGGIAGGGWGTRVSKQQNVGAVEMLLDPDGAPRVQLIDTRQRRAALGATRVQAAGGPTRTAPSSVVLFDESGNLIWSAP